MKIVAAIPTRGVIATECIGAVIREFSVLGKEWGVSLSTGLPIPNAHNAVAEDALKQGADYVWFVEEDVVPPPETLQHLLDLNADIAVVDVPSRHVDGLTQIAKHKDEIYFCHTGCTLIKKEVFQKIKKPWFDNKVSYNFSFDGDNLVMKEVALKEELDYGGQDVYFCMKARKEGFKIQQLPGVATHLQFEFNKDRTSVHKVKPLKKVTRTNLFRP